MALKKCGAPFCSNIVDSHFQVCNACHAKRQEQQRRATQRKEDARRRRARKASKAAQKRAAAQATSKQKASSSQHSWQDSWGVLAALVVAYVMYAEMDYEVVEACIGGLIAGVIVKYTIAWLLVGGLIYLISLYV